MKIPNWIWCIFWTCLAMALAGQSYHAPQWIMTPAWGCVVCILVFRAMTGSAPIRVATVLTFGIASMAPPTRVTQEALIRLVLDSHKPWLDDLLTSHPATSLMAVFFFFAYSFSEVDLRSAREHGKHLEQLLESSYAREKRNRAIYMATRNTPPDPSAPPEPPLD